MLSLKGSKGHAWRCTFCEAIKTKLGHEKHDYDDDTVAEFFAEASIWASNEKIEVPSGIDHAAAFIESRNAGGDIRIPEFVRLYCAHVTKTPYLVEKFNASSPVTSSARNHVPARKSTPPLPVLRSPSRGASVYA